MFQNIQIRRYKKISLTNGYKLREKVERHDHTHLQSTEHIEDFLFNLLNHAENILSLSSSEKLINVYIKSESIILCNKF